jgi:hypothetical protein
MNCEEFLKLPLYQQSIYMASLIHACISDDANFKSGQELIRIGKQKGLFDDVKIGHEDVFKLDENKMNSIS